MPTKYVLKENIPKIGSQCSLCVKDFILDSKWEGVYCPQCKTNWRESKWDKAKPETKDKTGDILILEELQAFRKEVNERLDSLGEYLSKKLK